MSPMLLVWLVLPLLVGCSLFPAKKDEELLRRIAVLESLLEKQGQVLEDLRIRQDAQNQPTSAPVAITPDPEGLAQNQAGPLQQINERVLYAKVIECYQAKSSDLLKRATQILIKNYPHSAYSDNSVYLMAQLAVEKERWSEVYELSYKFKNDYPLSEKLGAMILLEARAVHHLGRDQEALTLLNEVQMQFPDSLEALQASELISRLKETL